MTPAISTVTTSLFDLYKIDVGSSSSHSMGAVRAVHAARIALNETEAHKVSLDQVIRTMVLTGLDMQSRTKETSLAGLALNVIEC
jgi:L-serine dehydratase